MLDDRIAAVKDILSKDSLSLTEFSIFGSIGDEYVPAAFNAWRESDDKLAIGEVTEKDTFRIEGIDKVMRGIDVPQGFQKCNDPKGKGIRGWDYQTISIINTRYRKTTTYLADFFSYLALSLRLTNITDYLYN